MARFVIVGAGGVGRHTAQALIAGGHEVRMVSRSGADPVLPDVEAVAADAADFDAMRRAADGAEAIINAANPRRYHTWARDWPPLAENLLATAQDTGAGLVTISNLYAYGRVSAPMTEATPVGPNGLKGAIRAEMWAQALVAHQAGRLRACEVRASDYFGPGVGSRVSVLNETVIAKASAGSRVRFPIGDLDAEHSWSYVPDVGRFAALLATEDRAWGRVWHAPTAAPRSVRQVAHDVAEIAEVSAPAVSTVPRWMMSLARVHPMIRELDETRHQFDLPFVIDSRAATEMFGLEATPWREALAATLDDLRSGHVLQA